ncbi:hypothetical protein DDZ18_03070 [Marinicauda salina]|uniref:Uncharacterized protein n=1 Tax=Marinicauda salina TaxID=2135793 RepID=A0A2U2BX83_9PROT|nr:hypothetical protein [Marinicauda salina]PWE18600.1 hypothetical protein DDZ18_03070 [Marinicauda salina]
MQLVKPTLFRAARLWWSIAWRSAAFGLAGGLIAAVFIAVIGVIAGASDETLAQWAQGAGFLIATPSCIYAAYSRIGKACGDFRLVLVRVDDPLEI